MSQHPGQHSGPTQLAREFRVRYGAIRRHPKLARNDWFMTIERDCFWFKTGTGYLIYYRKGEGVTVEREPRADPEE